MVTLVTGATGFLGGHVVRRLRAQGEFVVMASRYDLRPETRFLLGPDADSIPLRVLAAGDDAEYEALFSEFQPDAVVHLDAIVDVPSLNRQPLRAVEYNFLPTVRVLELARRFGTRHFVYCSSVAVLPTIQHEPIRADHPIITRSEGPGGGFYGASKVAGEAFALSYGEQFEIDVRVVRPSAIYGFGMQWPIGVKPLIEGAVDDVPADALLDGPPRDFTHVDDVAQLIELLLSCPPGADRVFFAGTGNPLVTPRDLLKTARCLLPSLVIRPQTSHSDDLAAESKYRGVIDIEPALTQLGFRPRYSRLSDGLAEYVETYRHYRAARVTQ